jgi:glycosyltransferase involved in cell wall biosynthesis
MTSQKKAPRIVVFGNSASSMINFRGPLIKHLVSNGFDVFALAPGYDATTKAAINDLGATPVDLIMSRSGKNPFDEVRLCVQLFNILRSIRPDALLSYFIKPAIYGSIVGWMAKTPMRIALIEGLGYSFQKSAREGHERILLRSIVTLMFRFALAKASKIVVLNEDDRQQFMKMNVGVAGEIENIGGIGVDLDEFAYQPPALGPLTFLCAARLIREKGIVDFADAARIVKLARPDIQFVVLGGVDNNPGSLEAETIEQWVKEGILAWPGTVADVRPWLAACSVFVLPSYYREGVPRSIQEAMAIGRAIITTDNVGCRDTVEPEVNGLIVTPQQPQELAEAILELAKDVKRIAAMGEESRALAEARYDAKRFNSRITELAFPTE